MIPGDVKSDTYIESIKKINDKDSKFEVGDIVLKYQNIKMLLRIFTLQIGLRKLLFLKKIKKLCPGYVINNLNIKKKLLENFYKFFLWKLLKKNCKKQVKKSLELKKKNNKEKWW